MTEAHTATGECYRTFCQWVTTRRNVLIITHVRPDGDALGSAFGCQSCLSDIGISSLVYLPEPVPERYQGFAPEALQIGGEIALPEFDAILALDSATAKRLGVPPNIDPEHPPVPLYNIDHHVDNALYGYRHVVDSAVCATSEVLCRCFEHGKIPFSAHTATLLFLGIVTDTGGFRFTNTDSNTFQAASRLLDNGADFERVMRIIFFNEPIGLMRLRAEIVANMRFAYGGQLVYFFLTPEMLDRFGVKHRDTEDLIESVRVVRGAKIVCRMQEVESGIRFSLRSQDSRVPVIDIAHRLGGGGHRMAAGASQDGISFEEAEALLLAHTQELLSGSEDH